jgi:hypothetical protein
VGEVKLKTTISSILRGEVIQFDASKIK